MKKQTIIWIVSILVILTITSLILATKLGFSESFRAVFGLFGLIFLPGYVWTWAFFPRKDLDIVQRILLAIALSIALGPMVLFFFNKLGVKISIINIIWEILLLIAVGGLSYYWQLKKRKTVKKEST